SSWGGRSAVEQLTRQICVKRAAAPGAIAVIKLEVGYRPSAKYGSVPAPKFTIVGWVDDKVASAPAPLSAVIDPEIPVQPNRPVSGVSVTFFPDFAARTKREETMTLTAIAEIIQTTAAPEKGRLPWLKMAKFGGLRSPKNSLRHDDNVIRISGVEAD